MEKLPSSENNAKKKEVDLQKNGGFKNGLKTKKGHGEDFLC